MSPRFALFLAAILTSVCALPAAHAELRTLFETGDADRRLDIVIVAEGYRAKDKEVFFTDAKTTATGVLVYGPYKAARDLINVHGLFVASAESGADHPSTGKKADTAFNATYESGGIKRLITANDGKVLAEVTKWLPAWDVAVLLVNDPQYGGSGGPVAVASVHKQSVNILRHELAHTIAGLADEYTAPYPGKPVADPEPNVALEAHIHPPKWHPWIEKGTPIPTLLAHVKGPHSPIGAYEGARYQSKGMYRPAPKCLMRSLGDDFCPVCWEAMYLALLGKTATIATALPTESTVTCPQYECPLFTVDVAKIEGLRALWLLDGKKVHINEGAEVFYRPSGIPPGTYELTAQVQVQSDKIRKDDVRLGETQRWTVIITPQDDPDAPLQPPPPDCTVGPGQPRPVAVMLLLLAIGLVLLRRRWA